MTSKSPVKVLKAPSLVAPSLVLLWYRATLDLTDSSAQQAKTTQKNEPVQSCPVPVEPLPVFRPHTTSAPLTTYHFCMRSIVPVLRLKFEAFRFKSSGLHFSSPR